MKPPDYVAGVYKHAVSVRCHDGRHLRQLEALGGLRRCGSFGPEWGVPYETAQDLARLFARLRGLGFAFQAGARGWEPAAVFDKLRKSGILAGSYVEIRFDGKGPLTRIR